MANTVQLIQNGQPIFPVTDVSLIMGLQDAIKLPPVKVTTLPTASNETAGKMYYVGPDGNGEYTRHITSAVNGSYEWIDLGNTAIPLPSIADNLETDDSNTALSAKQGKVLDGKISQLEAEMAKLSLYTGNPANGETLFKVADLYGATRVYYDFDVPSGQASFIELMNASDQRISYIGKGSSSSGALHYDGYFDVPSGFSYAKFTTSSPTAGQTTINKMAVQPSSEYYDTIKEAFGDIAELQVEVDGISGDVYAEPIVSSTTTNAFTPSSYVNKSGGPIEDTTQVMPTGAKLTKIKMFSTGLQNTVATSLYIYDENRILVRQIYLGVIQATDTDFDVSSQNIIIQSGYHYAFDRIGYKYDTSIPNGRFLVAYSGAQTDTKSWFGWTFTYETPQTKLDEFIEEHSDLFDKSLRIANPLMPGTYPSYANSYPVDDLWQDLPVGAKLTKVHCSTIGAAGGNFTFLHIYDENRTQVGERIQLGQIKATDTTFDISAKNIIVQEGYHYCIQYVASQYLGTNINHYRYYAPVNDSYPYSGYQFGFSFEFETTKDKRPETELSGKYASFIGDSICEGAGCPGGYALLMARKYGMLPPQNNGSSGAIVTSIASESSRVYINTMVDKMDGNADYYIAEGGVNDSDLSAPLGALSSGYTAELDTATFYGAMETLCKNLATLHHGKKVGYIFAHRVSLTTKYAYDYTGENNYYRAAKECCEKWGIPFLDLNKHCPPLGCVASLKSSYTNNGDGYHPNEAGYTKYYVDRIASWMLTL